MDTEEYFVRSRLFRRLKIGSHGQLIERFAARLVEDGLARQGTWRCLTHSAAMELLQAGVNCSVIALWLGHESIATTQTYLHAHLALKEAALAKLKPYERGKRTWQTS